PPLAAGATTPDRVVPRPSGHRIIGAPIDRAPGPCRAVSDAPPPERSEPIVSDLVEYLIVVAPDQNALGTVAPALVELVESDTIRILDLVVLARERDGAVTVLEGPTVAGAAELARLDVAVGGMLTAHDVELAAM